MRTTLAIQPGVVKSAGRGSSQSWASDGPAGELPTFLCRMCGQDSCVDGVRACSSCLWQLTHIACSLLLPASSFPWQAPGLVCLREGPSQEGQAGSGGESMSPGKVHPSERWKLRHKCPQGAKNTQYVVPHEPRAAARS